MEYKPPKEEGDEDDKERLTRKMPQGARGIGDVPLPEGSERPRKESKTGKKRNKRSRSRSSSDEPSSSDGEKR
jgi:hypothetical protein